MTIRVYLKPELPASEFTRHDSDLFAMFRGTRVFVDDGRWYLPLSSLMDRIPEIIADVVEEVSFQDKFTIPQQNGVAGGAEFEVSSATRTIRVRAKTLREVAVVLSQLNGTQYLPRGSEPASLEPSIRPLAEDPPITVRPEKDYWKKQARQGGKKAFGQLLKEMELVTEDDVQHALKIQRDQGGLIGQILIDLDLLSPEDRDFALAAQLGMEMVDLHTIEIPDDVLAMIDDNVVQTYKIIPVSFQDGVLTVAMADPSNSVALDDLALLLNFEIKGMVASEEAVTWALKDYYDMPRGQIEAEEIVIDDIVDEFSEGVDPKNQDVPVIRLLVRILNDAVEKDATHIIVDPRRTSDDQYISHRIASVDFPAKRVSFEVLQPIIQRLKVMAGIDLAEMGRKRGSFRMRAAGQAIRAHLDIILLSAGEVAVLELKRCRDDDASGAAVARR